ncbi:unnamed protein product [Rotaria sp. Silwood1]|nr:unnamed protein product [Rotaria sp. Silwood1]CAF3488389.1 unnamed protein product [Rotaria sp. Silwood1]CAF3502618.1 unnamed protein product [Rotaria sp. Silwood1]CAF4862305.1 unnamed protein product [Rotaria sp. Silwood1]
MFQNRRTILLFIFSIVFVQALYYIVTLQIKENKTRLTNFPSIILYESKSDIEKIIIQDIKNFTLYNNTSLQKELNPFIDNSLLISTNFTKPDPNIYNSLPICNFSISNNNSSFYKVTISNKIYSFDIIEKHHGNDLYIGGHWFPKTCQTEQRLAIIICYRNRESHLKLFLDNIHPFLKQQQLDYTIFIINQHGQEQFNRAALFNVGFIEAMKLYSFNCFIFHDVDLLPEDLRNLYKCGEKPRHMSVAVDKFHYRLLYSTLFGGVTAFSLSDFIGSNGYPTIYWGWGGEDDDMYLRVVKKLKKSITRYPIEIARYKMIRTLNHTSGKPNPNRHVILYSKYNYNHDGINTTNYKIHDIVFHKLYTFINVTLPEESFKQICMRLNITKRERKKTRPQKIKTNL